jgi:ssDNA-binding Zn-finger/Zn-ribbon topoisomerase 1
MQLINGKFGKFWGCTNYPNCKCTVSTLENLKQKRKSFNSVYTSSIDDYDDDATDYMPDIF